MRPYERAAINRPKPICKKNNSIGSSLLVFCEDKKVLVGNLLLLANWTWHCNYSVQYLGSNYGVEACLIDRCRSDA